jgi:RNA polymerase sigma factor (sigma-70 family)
MTTHRKHHGHEHQEHDEHRGHDGHGHDHEHEHEEHDEHCGHDGHGHDHGRHHGHDEHDVHRGHGGHGHAHRGHESRLGRAELERDLGVLMVQARQHFGTERGTRAYERIVAILTRPGMRVARGKLEDLLSRGEVNSDDVNEIVYSAHFQLYQMLDRYTPGTPVIPWFATIVRNKAIDFVRQQYHTRAKQPPDLLRYDELSFVITAREDDVDMRLDIQEVLHGLAPENHQVLSLLESGHSTAEIAVMLGQSESWVRARRKVLRAEFSALR